MAEDKRIVILISNCVLTKDELQRLFYEKKRQKKKNKKQKTKKQQQQQQQQKRNYTACGSFDKWHQSYLLLVSLPTIFGDFTQRNAHTKETGAHAKLVSSKVNFTRKTDIALIAS